MNKENVRSGRAFEDLVADIISLVLGEQVEVIKKRHRLDLGTHKNEFDILCRFKSEEFDDQLIGIECKRINELVDVEMLRAFKAKCIESKVNTWVFAAKSYDRVAIGYAKDNDISLIQISDFTKEDYHEF